MFNCKIGGRCSLQLSLLTVQGFWSLVLSSLCTCCTRCGKNIWEEPGINIWGVSSDAFLWPLSRVLDERDLDSIRRDGVRINLHGISSCCSVWGSEVACPYLGSGLGSYRFGIPAISRTPALPMELAGCLGLPCTPGQRGTCRLLAISMATEEILTNRQRKWRGRKGQDLIWSCCIPSTFVKSKEKPITLLLNLAFISSLQGPRVSARSLISVQGIWVQKGWAQ